MSNSTSEYRTRTDLYRGDGTVYERDQVLDNGTTSRTLYASAGDWFVEYTYSYAADGFLSEWSGLRSNGNRWDYLYGRDGSVVY
uniref:hypothetical protein n=1 Tax=Escherichia coli TaxID=562 RepID=UPI00200CCA51